MAKVRPRKWTDAKGKPHLAYVVDYKDAEGVRRTPQFDKKHQADAHLRKVQRELEDGVHQASSQTVTIAETCRRFLVYSETRKSDGRIGGMRLRSLGQGVRNSIVPHLGTMNVSALTSLRVEQFYEEMVSRDNLKPVSAKNRLQMLSQIIDFAIKHQIAKTNPVQQANKSLRGTSKSKVRIFTKDEVVRLLAAASVRRKGEFHHSHATIALMVNLAAFCGLRYGEIVGLKVEAVDLDARIVRVRHSLSRVDGLKHPKTVAGNRDVPMPSHLVAMVRAYLGGFHLPNPDGLIVRNVQGGTIPANNFHQHHWPRLLGHAGLLDDGERYHFHALRHFCGSRWISLGMPVTDVAKLLGHGKVDMTLSVYAHAMSSNDTLHAAIERMSRDMIAAPIVVEGLAGPAPLSAA